METLNAPFWWPKDAGTHSDRSRCATCGHADAYHNHSRKGRNAGSCNVKSLFGDACPCAKFADARARVSK